MGQSDFNIRIDLPSTHRFLNVAGLGIDAILQRLDDLIPGAEQVSSEVQIATQEICANIVDHAYIDGESGRVTIEISIGLEASRLDIHIHDTGKEFDENVVCEPALGELQERGFGLYFAKQFTIDVDHGVVFLSCKMQRFYHISILQKRAIISRQNPPDCLVLKDFLFG